MNNEDKILLMSYVDNELNSKEVLKAEILINSNEAAMNFVNQLKTANNSMQAAYQTDQFIELDKRLDTFINKNFIKEKSSIVESISGFFISRQTLNYSLTALFFLSVGIFYDDYSSQVTFESELFEEVLQDNSMSLGSDIYLKEIFKTRGLESDVNVIKNYIEQTIVEMLEKNTSEGLLKYGTENVEIFLEEKTMEKDSLTCYSGNIFINGSKSNILFCSSINDTSLIYTN